MSSSIYRAVNTTLIYIECGGEYLMLHRTKKENDCNRDKWIGIGGKFEEGESPEECAPRGRATRSFCACSTKTYRFSRSSCVTRAKRSRRRSSTGKRWRCSMDKLLVSACLLGTPCRYDGKSKADARVQALVGKYVSPYMARAMWRSCKR